MKTHQIYSLVLLVLLSSLIPGVVRAQTTYLSSTEQLSIVLVLINAQNQDQMDAAIATIEQIGAKVLVSVPFQGLFVYAPQIQAEKLHDLPGVRAVIFNAADPTLAGADVGAYYAIVSWNTRLASATLPQTLPKPDLPDNDVLIPIDWIQQQSNLTVNTNAPAVYQTSEYMLRSVQVDVFMPESDGSIDGNYENWSTNMRDQVVANVTNGILWWASTATQNGHPSADLTANIVFHTPFNEPNIVATGYEPIQHPYIDEKLWMGQIMTHLGYTDYYLNAIRQYAHDRRIATNRDWAFTVWVVNSLNDTDGQFTDGYFGYAYLFGPAIVMTYDNDGWGIDDMDIVMAHEMAHTFGALDEYAESGCSDSQHSGYLDIANTNCENGTPATETSIMRGGSNQTVAYANHLASTPVRGMIGWRDSDSDGLYDPIDTTPTVSLYAYSPDPTSDSTPTWLGQAEDVPYVSPTHPDVSLNHISTVQYRIDNGEWINCNATDGSFDETEEAFDCTSPELSDGTHTIQVRSRNRVDQYSTIDSDTLVIDATPPTQASNIRTNGWTGPYTNDTTPAFAWNTATDGGSGLAGYYVAVDDRTPDGGGGNDWWAGNVTTYNVPNALPEGQHRFAVTSKDNAGNLNPVDGGRDAPHYTFYVDITPPTAPQITISGSGCSGIPNNTWQNTCRAPIFSWTSSDSFSGVKDYRYYWGTSASGVPTTVTTIATFAPGAIAPVGSVASMYFNITARDQLDHESGRTSFGVRYDGEPPSVTLAINRDGETTNQVNVWLNLTTNDAGSGVNQMRFSSNGLDWTTWEAYSSIKSWILPALNRRAHTVYVQVRDRAGNESGIANDSIILDLYPVMPHSASYRICDDLINVGGSVGLASTSFSLISSIGQPWVTGANANSSIAHTERSGFLASLDGCRPITHSITTNYTVTQWVVASGGNLRGSASFRLGDTAGQPAASGTGAFTSSSFTLSSGFWAQITGTVPLTTPIPPTPPPPTPTPSPTPGPTPTPQPGSFGVSINGGALYTNDPTVTVNAWAPNVTQVRLSNDGGYADAGWTTYQLTHTWTISTYGAYVIPRVVYAWFKDTQSAVYGPYQDDIVYDPIAPHGRVQIVGQIAHSARHTPLSATPVVTLNLEASDDNSGVAYMRLGENTLESATWQPFTDTVTWTLHSDIVYVQFRDRAGNVSSLYSSDGREHALASRPLDVTLSGPTLGLTNTTYTFSADVLPVTATLPITYVWQATGHTPVTHSAALDVRDVLSFTWDMTGTQTLTVTALNSLGIATGTYTITLLGSTPTCARPLTDVDIDGPLDYYTATLYIDTLYTFVAILTPHDATWPITYTWAPPPEFGQGSPYSSYQWGEPGTYTIALAAQNCGGISVQVQRTVTVHSMQHVVYLPLVVRNQ